MYRATPMLGCFLGAILVTGALGGCAEPLPRKRSFMAYPSGNKSEEAVPQGLNPLGSLETCPLERLNNAELQRVVISRPEFFTRDASGMILSLRDSLLNQTDGLKPVELMLSRKPLNSTGEAHHAGKRCGAMIVLWEKPGTETLELTISDPSRVPVRGLVHEKLCEFGNHSEQATILYYTIMGMSALAQNKIDKGYYYLSAAGNIDAHCLKLPGSPGVEEAAQKPS